VPRLLSSMERGRIALGPFAMGSAIFLILELNQLYSGLFKVPRGAMQQAIEALG
jgi:hypothetical protein